MAKLKRTVNGDFDQIIRNITNEVLNGSASASLEETVDFSQGNARCSTRVFERYSWMGGNRVSLTMTFFQAEDGPVYISAITSGGSQAVFMKVNTMGEEAFLDKVQEAIDRLKPFLSQHEKTMQH